MRLIDADALSEKLCKTTVFIKDGEKFQRMINDAPTVSADARPTGEWVHEVDTGTAMLTCSLCGRRVVEKWYRLAVGDSADKCPYCGARMLGEDGDEE